MKHHVKSVRFVYVIPRLLPADVNEARGPRDAAPVVLDPYHDTATLQTLERLHVEKQAQSGVSTPTPTTHPSAESGFVGSV